MFESDALVQAGMGLIAGLVFGLYGFLTKRDAGEPLNPKKLARTVVIYGAAGAIVGLQPDSNLSPATVEAATTQTVVLGQVVDMAWSRLKRPQARSSSGA